MAPMISVHQPKNAFPGSVRSSSYSNCATSKQTCIVRTRGGREGRGGGRREEGGGKREEGRGKREDGRESE